MSTRQDRQQIAARDLRLISVAAISMAMYNIHMKRTNLMLSEQLLEEAVRVSGIKTYSGAVNMALRDFVRRAQARRILELAGSGLWGGDLSDMRRDRPRRRHGRVPR